MTMEIRAIALFGLFFFFSACEEHAIDPILIKSEAHNVQRISIPESNSQQISYYVNLTYPAKALTSDDLDKLLANGWSKCSSRKEGWDSFVDASKGAGHEQTVFQDVTYWRKRNRLLTVSLMYFASVTNEKQPLKEPDNAEQRVIILMHEDRRVFEKLGIAC